MITTVLIADDVPDSVGDVFLSSGVQHDDIVPVTIGFQGPQLGTARLFWEGNELRAEFNIQDEEIKKALPYVFPAIGGRIIKRENEIITSSLVEEIGVSVFPNADPRIKKVGSQ